MLAYNATQGNVRLCPSPHLPGTIFTFYTLVQLGNKLRPSASVTFGNVYYWRIQGERAGSQNVLVASTVNENEF